MGIRFYCPNGHRLHVKSFLAGKRGICPHCAARFRIPPESEIPRGSPKIKPNAGAAASTSIGKRHLTSATVTASASTDSPAETKQRLQPNSSAIDPITEAPDAIWYVRPPSGGQFGPAKGEVMRRWIVEGRVSADSLVWREGWPDWVTAGPVFPTLNPTYTASASTTAKREAVSLQLQPAATEPPTGSRPTVIAARAATQPKSLAAVIVLVLIVVALLAVLVYVLTTKS